MSFKRIKQHQNTIRNLIKEELSSRSGKQKTIIEWALNSGKRVRSAIALELTGDSDFALFIEYMHTVNILCYEMHGMIEINHRKAESVNKKYGYE